MRNQRSILKGTSGINIHVDELSDLLLRGDTAQATIDDQKLAYLQNLSSHQALNNTHRFECVATIDGLGPYKCLVEISQISDNYYLGKITYKYIGTAFQGRRNLSSGE